MITGLPALTYEQQQQAVERIHQLMSEGMSSGQAIQLVAAEIRKTHSGNMVAMRFEDEDMQSGYQPEEDLYEGNDDHDK